MSEEVGRKILEQKVISIPELKDELEKLGEVEHELFNIPRRVKEYLNKFSKVDPETARKIKPKLIEVLKEEFDEESAEKYAVQIINILPRYPEEVRVILGRAIAGEAEKKVIELLKNEGVI